MGANSTVTKPVRIYEGDHAPLKMLAAATGCSPAEMVHVALQEYLENHRPQLAKAFRRAQTAVVEGDLQALTSVLDAGAADLARQHAERLRALRG